IAIIKHLIKQRAKASQSKDCERDCEFAPSRTVDSTVWKKGQLAEALSLATGHTDDCFAYKVVFGGFRQGSIVCCNADCFNVATENGDWHRQPHPVQLH